MNLGSRQTCKPFVGETQASGLRPVINRILEFFLCPYRQSSEAHTAQKAQQAHKGPKNALKGLLRPITAHMDYNDWQFLQYSRQWRVEQL